MKTYFLSILLASILLAACAGSPRVVVNKNIEVHIEGVQASPQNPYYPFPVYIDIDYETNSSIPIEAEVEQEISPDVTIPIR